MLSVQVLAGREAGSKDLQINISELEANTNDLHTKFKSALARLKKERIDGMWSLSHSRRTRMTV